MGANACRIRKRRPAFTRSFSTFPHRYSGECEAESGWIPQHFPLFGFGFVGSGSPVNAAQERFPSFFPLSLILPKAHILLLREEEYKQYVGPRHRVAYLLVVGESEKKEPPPRYQFFLFFEGRRRRRSVCFRTGDKRRSRRRGL